jgi:hypothetical protein
VSMRLRGHQRLFTVAHFGLQRQRCAPRRLAVFSQNVVILFDITVAGVPPSGKSLVHDRWWIVNGGALDFGTSANAFGYGQESKVERRDATVAGEMESAVDRYLQRVIRCTDQGRIAYVTFAL